MIFNKFILYSSKSAVKIGITITKLALFISNMLTYFDPEL